MSRKVRWDLPRRASLAAPRLKPLLRSNFVNEPWAIQSFALTSSACNFFLAIFRKVDK